jgi:NADPH2:quinone reductase
MEGVSMRACVVGQLGEPKDVLVVRDLAEPSPEPGQVLVDVRASIVNFPDVLLCRGEYQLKPDLPFTPGVELCGEVIAVGDGVDARHLGRRVVGSPVFPRGGFAERAVLAADRLLTATPALDDAEAAALYIGYQTGWFGLHRRARLQAGETLLVHAAAGGVGSAAVQLGKAAGARVIAVAGGADKARFAAALGADVVVNRHEEDFVAVVNDVTGGRGADVIYDPVGGDTYTRSAKCVAFEGRILVIGFAGGTIQSPGLNHALVKNYSIVGLHWGLYNNRDRAAVEEAHEQLSALVDTGRIKPLISERVGLDDLALAAQRVADGESVGRVALVPGFG